MNEGNQDFRNIILSQQQDVGPQVWEGTFLEYLDLVKERPEIASFAPGRIYNMIMKHGISEVPNSIKIKGYEDAVWYNFFNDKMYGRNSKTALHLHDLMKFFKAAARRTETGKRILVLKGPVASGKSSVSNLIKKGLENDDTPIYAIKDCPIHEEPLHLIPEKFRPEWNEKLGVKIEGDLCPVCQQRIKENFTNSEGIVEWHKVPVEMIELRENTRTGIGTFTPSDPKSQDITELIGRVNMAKAARYGETDARAYQFDGELQASNRGMIEYIEIMKADIKFHSVLINLAQEQVIKAPGFPLMYLDELIFSHTNSTEFAKFAAKKENEALHDRIYVVDFGWNDRINTEVKIYKKMIAESEFADFHQSPGALEVAAQFAVLSRLAESEKINPIKKMQLYNGDYVKEFSKGKDRDIKKIREEGISKGECMTTGISPRFIINALNIILGQRENVKCITPMDVVRAVRDNFKHATGIEEKDQTTFMNLLMGDKDSVIAEMAKWAKKEVSTAFIHAFDDQAAELFHRYMINAESFCKEESILDEITGEYRDPDEKIMRALEELIPVPVESKREFRQQIFVYKSDCLQNEKEFKWDSYMPLKEAIEKKLQSDLKNVVQLSIADSTTTAPKAQKRRTRALKQLEKKGYCPHCAKQLLTFVSGVLRREN